jgi:hypothetical protein
MVYAPGKETTTEQLRIRGASGSPVRAVAVL